jgi:hypothetical protein
MKLGHGARYLLEIRGIGAFDRHLIEIVIGQLDMFLDVRVEVREL